MDHREHSIYFDDYNTWDMWRIVPSSRPTPTIPEVQTNIVEIPGRSGSLDLSEALTGYPLFNNRSLEVQFIVLDQRTYWMDIYTDIVEKLHGKRMKIRLIDDPDWYYEGRVTVNFTSNSDFSSIDISCDLDPFRYSYDEKINTTEVTYSKFNHLTTWGTTSRYSLSLLDQGVDENDNRLDLAYDLPTNEKTRIVYEPEIIISDIVGSYTGFYYRVNNPELNISSYGSGLRLVSGSNKGKGIIASNQNGSNLVTLDIARPSEMVDGNTFNLTLKLREKRI